MYPRVHRVYKDLCLRQYNNAVGMSYLVEDDGDRVVLMCTKKHRRQTVEIEIENLKSCLEQITRLVSTEREIYSGIIGRESGNFNQHYKVITDWCKAQGYTWNICRKGVRK